MGFSAAYIKTYESGRLRKKIEAASAILRDCTLCPRTCRVDRTEGELGFCGVAKTPLVSSSGPHFGEEPPLVGRHGSGTIFFTGCNLLCLYCQNYEISHRREGKVITLEELSGLMLYLQKLGCHNINFVSPSHQIPQILAALEIAIPKGLSVPLVYNSGGYDSGRGLELMEGVTDIYMPDIKYQDAGVADWLSKGAGDYPEVAFAALREMHRQVGDLVINRAGIAERGLLIRHLVLPGGLAGSEEVFRFIAAEISPDSYVNIMDQYHPAGAASGVSPLNRPITRQEYSEAVKAAKKEGLHRGFPG